MVRGGVIASEPDYSIKSLEVFTGIERAGEVKTAGGSVVAYERWLEERDDAILAEIEDYNRIDCVSTEKLRDWLVAIRPAGPWPALAAGPGRRRGRGGRRGRGAPGEARRLERSTPSGSGSSSTSASSTGARRSPPSGRSSTASAGTPTS